MRSRWIVALGVLALMSLSACSGGESVPEDQALVPASTPEGWNEQEIGGVRFATPPEWKELELPDASEGTARVAFADEPSPSGSTGGIVVMVLPEADLPAKTQTQTFVTNAKNREQATDASMEEVVWPHGEESWYSTYVAQVGTDETAPHPTSHLVIDLKNGYQVQATVRAEEGSPAAEHLKRALSTIRITDDVAITEDA